MKILLLDDDDRFRQFLIANLEQSFGEIDVIECATPREAILIYESDPYFQVILSTLDLKSGSFMEVFQHFQDSQYQIPIITYSEVESESPLASLPLVPKSKEDEYKLFMERLLLTPPFSGETENILEKYTRVRLFFFYRFEEVDFPIYIRLNDDKFVKVLNSNENFGPEFLEKYQNKNIRYLYVEEKDFSKFAKMLYTAPLFGGKTGDDPLEYKRRKTMFLQEMAKTVGITPNILETAEGSLAEIIEEAKGKKTLSKLLHILENSGSYNSDHATLLAYVTAAMCDELGWTTRRSKEKLGFASLFHDITLIDPRLAVLNYRSIAGLTRFDKKVQEKFKEHPLKSSELVREITAKYPQVDTIIEQHHERPDGTGFPYGKDYNQITPLSCVFIVAHDFVSRVYEINFDLSDPQKILDEMVPEYRLGHFNRCMLALQSVLTRDQIQD